MHEGRGPGRGPGRAAGAGRPGTHASHPTSRPIIAGETVSHYNGLNALMTTYGFLSPGLRVLGTPCNQFAGQE